MIRFSSRERALLAGLLLAGLLVRAAFALAPYPLTDSLLLSDDSYIALNISRNLALGNGEMADSFNRTNGYQPLYVWLMVPVFKAVGGDRVLAVRIALLLLSLFNVLAGYFLYRLARLSAGAGVSLLVLAFWLFEPQTVRLGVNGLETSISLFFLVATLYYFNTRIRERQAGRPLFYLGALLGACVLARVDGVFFAGIILLFSGVRAAREADPGGRTRAFFIKPLIAAGGMLLVLSPWFANNLINHHTLVPESGEGTRFQSTISPTGQVIPYPGWVRRNLSEARTTALEEAPAYATLKTRGLIGLFFALALALAGMALPGRRAPGAAGFRRPLALYGPLLIHCLCLWLFYTAYVGGRWYYGRYMLPLGAAYVLILAVLGQNALAWLANKAILRRAATAAAIFLLVVVQGSGLYDAWVLTNRESGGYRPIGEWINTLPPGTVAGTFQSGAMSYFADKDHKVLNLDGKVNRNALHALKTRTMYRYVKSMNVDYIVDWQTINIPRLLHFRSRDGWNSRNMRYLGSIPGIRSWGTPWLLVEVK